MIVRSRLVLLLALGLSACLDRGDYPSLKPRAFERAGGEATTLPTPAPATPADPALAGRVAALVATAEAGERAFAAELSASRAIIARAGAPDSESWITAQEQLSSLYAGREPLLAVLAALDAMTLAGRDNAGAPWSEPDLATIRAGGERVGALLDAQQRELDALAGTIAAP